MRKFPAQGEGWAENSRTVISQAETTVYLNGTLLTLRVFFWGRNLSHRKKDPTAPFVLLFL